MKYKAKIQKLKNRVANWESSRVVTSANAKSPGTYKKPGSQKGR